MFACSTVTCWGQLQSRLSAGVARVGVLPSEDRATREGHGFQSGGGEGLQWCQGSRVRREVRTTEDRAKVGGPWGTGIKGLGEQCADGVFISSVFIPTDLTAIV